ncbi:hypothetical protein [Hymenobacter terrigena]
MNKTLYNSDSSVAVVNYTLDIGARGFAEYQTLLRKSDFQHDLSKFLLPAEYANPRWKGTDTLEVVFDEYRGLGGPQTKLPLDSDVVSQNGVVIVIVERKMNKQQMIHSGGREVNEFGGITK